jgi:hypothetical protein
MENRIINAVTVVTATGIYILNSVSAPNEN